MSEALQEIQRQAGAIFTEEGKIPLSFGNDEKVRQVALSEVGCVVCDRSHWGWIELSDQDCRQFLHNQTTNQIQTLQPGQGCETVFVTSTARTLDLASVYVTETGVWVLVSPSQHQKILTWLDRYLFPMDRVKITDHTSEYAIFSLLGAESDFYLQKLGLEALVGQPEGTHGLFDLLGEKVRVAVGSGLALPGYTFFIPQTQAATVWETLLGMGGIPMGDRVWEQLRIQQGRPAPQQELTEDYNPLEAGLWDRVSFNKGCYIGQETIARLNTYKGVKQRLWGVKLNHFVTPGSPVIVEDQKVGILTSCTDTPDGIFGLAYVKTKAGGEGLQVQVETATGELKSVPFLTHLEQKI